MRGFTKLSVLPAVLVPLALLSAVPAQAAVSPPGLVELQALGLAVGVEDNGYLLAVGPAAIVSLLCIDGLAIGAVCAFTGDNETGTGAIIIIGDNFPVDTACADIPLPKVDSINNVTNETVPLRNGSCASPGTLDTNVRNNDPENVPQADAQI